MPFWTDNRSLRDAISGHDNNYTLIRAILAASVIFYHSFGLTFDTRFADPIDAALLPTASLGELAVQSFFFLSGLFVTQSFFKDQNVLKFALRRVFRVWPGLFVCLAVTALLAVVISNPGDTKQFLVFSDFYEYILRNSAFDLHWYIPGVFDHHAITAINGPIHTLPLEMKMYVILGLVGAVGLLAAPRRVALTGIVVLIGCLTISSRIHGVNNLFDASYTRPAAAMFFAGVFVFAVSPWIYPRIWQGLVLGFLAAICSGALHQFLFFAAVVWALVYLGQLPLIGRVFRPRQDLSYGIYIYGWPCQQFVVAATSITINPYFLTALALPLACAFAVLSWRFVEKPAIRLGHYLPSMVRDFYRARRLVFSTAEDVRAFRFGLGLVATLSVCIGMKVLTTTHDFVTISPLSTHIVDFGPKDERRGASFNKQANGSSTIWVKLDSTPPEGTTVVLAGRRLQTSIGPNVATAEISANTLDTPGEKKLFLEYRSVNKILRSNSVVMLVSNSP
ncbi:acyltransferase family protein [Paraburkholderia saeva]|uniref:acyltransferase family protein n=1 Tax=Paraburkholderia saeva TaxID=2777537 RepID=UPI001DAEED65|nr:acyltransferase [Paraburkholderia saeva]CAG4900974.1 hypothetical protein R52603_02799 [Paraburkholderia saeva]